MGIDAAMARQAAAAGCTSVETAMEFIFSEPPAVPAAGGSPTPLDRQMLSEGAAGLEEDDDDEDEDEEVRVLTRQRDSTQASHVDMTTNDTLLKLVEMLTAAPDHRVFCRQGESPSGRRQLVWRRNERCGRRVRWRGLRSKPRS